MEPSNLTPFETNDTGGGTESGDPPVTLMSSAAGVGRKVQERNFNYITRTASALTSFARVSEARPALERKSAPDPRFHDLAAKPVGPIMQPLR